MTKRKLNSNWRFDTTQPALTCSFHGVEINAHLFGQATNLSSSVPSTVNRLKVKKSQKNWLKKHTNREKHISGLKMHRMFRVNRAFGVASTPGASEPTWQSQWWDPNVSNDIQWYPMSQMPHMQKQTFNSLILSRSVVYSSYPCTICASPRFGGAVRELLLLIAFSCTHFLSFRHM